MSDDFDPPLTGIKSRIFNLIRLRPGIGSNDLVNWVYSDDVNGGPDTGQKVIHVHINQINRRLRYWNADVRIRGNKWKGYRIIRERSDSHDR